MRVCPVFSWLIAKVDFGQADVFGPLFYLCLKLQICLQVGFVGMFYLFRATLLSASLAVYWLGGGLKHK